MTSTIALTIASPRPVPGIACSVALGVRSKRRFCCSAEMPVPVSATSSATPAPLGELSRLAVLQKLDVASHRRQRGSKLVRDRGDEVVLHAVELLQLAVLRADPPHEPQRVRGEEPTSADREQRGEDARDERTPTRISCCVRTPARLPLVV
jgi:hypothetical protein